MLRDEAYDEWKTVVQYPPDPPRACGSDPMHMRTGDDEYARPLAERRREFHLGNGASAVVYRRTWTPGPWVAVDPMDGGAGSVAAQLPRRGSVADPPRPPALNLGTGSTRQTRQSAERNATDEPTAVDPQPKEG
jgi:hypothetical protein